MPMITSSAAVATRKVVTGTCGVVAGTIGTFYTARWFLYRPVQKKSRDDWVVTVDRSGGGL